MTRCSRGLRSRTGPHSQIAAPAALAAHTFPPAERREAQSAPARSPRHRAIQRSRNLMGSTVTG
eukprot:717184-Prymnesium_polylepis.1